MLKDKIESLINIIEGTEINEIEVSSFWGAQKIRLQKKHNVDVQTVIQPSTVFPGTIPELDIPNDQSSVKSVHEIITPEEATSQDSLTNTVEVISPLVGTFYQSTKPGTPPFVKVGDTIELGQTICIIEAMKIFNEIESEIAGKIVKIIVNDSSPVEYGQPLMLVIPS